GAHADAPAAADALTIVDGALAVFDLGAVVGADLLARAAADALLLIHNGLAGGVHFHLAGARAAAHAQVLEGTAEARHLMPLEVVEGDDDVGIHDGAADLGGFTEGTAHHRHLHIVGALQAVGN